MSMKFLKPEVTQSVLFFRKDGQRYAMHRRQLLASEVKPPTINSNKL